MRTVNPKPATAAPAVSPEMRKTIILGKIDKLQSKGGPADLYTWEYQKVRDFIRDVDQLKRLHRGPLSHILRISERVAKCYGVTMDQIDPCHGEAA